MAEWFTESERPERPGKTMQEKGEIVPSGSEPAFRGLRELGEMRISLQDAEWLKRLANILWDYTPKAPAKGTRK